MSSNPEDAPLPLNPSETYLIELDKHLAVAAEFRRHVPELQVLFEGVMGRVREFREHALAVGDERLRDSALELEATASQVQGYLNAQLPDPPHRN